MFTTLKYYFLLKYVFIYHENYACSFIECIYNFHNTNPRKYNVVALRISYNDKNKPKRASDE